MGLDVNGVGIIAVVCRGCGFKLYWYAIGDNGNRNKFNGPPTPSKAISGYDRGQCPLCGHKLPKKPNKIVFMTQKEFNDIYIVGDYKLIARRSIPAVSLEESSQLALTVNSAVENV